MNKYKLITKFHSNKYPVLKLCKMLNVSRSGYYEYPTRKNSKTTIKRESIKRQVIFVIYSATTRLLVSITSSDN